VVRPAAPPDGSQVASWLEAHHLQYGLGGHWQSSIVTVDTDGRHGVRQEPAVQHFALIPRLPQSRKKDLANGVT
jgi:hypothetical protein